jgi:hypothetical protein
MAAMSAPPARPRRAVAPGVGLVAALLLFGALFLFGLFRFTEGRRAAPPPPLRTEKPPATPR